MKTIKIKTEGQSSEIHFLQSPQKLKSILDKNVSGKKYFLITNKTIFAKHSHTLKTLFADLPITPLFFKDSESQKNLKTLESLAEKLIKVGADRNAVLVAFGGGVIGDMVGLLAALYMRGVGLVQIPTTLLAMVDSSVGGKTAVDLKSGKNLVGVFNQPRHVFIYPGFLSTLPRREWASGFAEVIKYGVILDSGVFQDLKKHGRKLLDCTAKDLHKIIMRCVELKSKVVIQDERESGLRAILNYGHTFGHALEKIFRFKKFKHGEAVALGMLFANRLALRTGFANVDLESELKALYNLFGLPQKLPKLNPKAVIQAMQSDKKTLLGNLRFVLAQKIGKVALVSVTNKDVLACLNDT